ncbi:MAG: hypothetical protein ACPGJE_02570 [Wenzhouxiangellaceae bacterium]
MSQSSRHEFIENLKQRLDPLDDHIEELQQKVRDTRGQASAEAENRLHDLREKRREARRKLEEIRAAGEEKWEALKAEAEHVWTALNNSLKYFRSHFD